MKKNLNPANFVKASFVVFALTGIYAFGYYGGKTSKILQDNTLTAPQARILADNYERNAPVINGVVESVYLDKTVLADLNAMLNVKRNADGIRLYFGKETSGSAANLLVAVTKNIDDTSFILKSAGIASPCPTVCDAQSALRN